MAQQPTGGMPGMRRVSSRVIIFACRRRWHCHCCARTNRERPHRNEKMTLRVATANPHSALAIGYCPRAISLFSRALPYSCCNKDGGHNKHGLSCKHTFVRVCAAAAAQKKSARRRIIIIIRAYSSTPIIVFKLAPVTHLHH